MLADFLNAKPLYYEVIDYERMPQIYKKIEEHFQLPKVIHIIGTNGKGTTGRFLATALYHLGYNTGHYTSPHILHFNERIWYNGKNSSMEILEKTHQQLLAILTKKDAHALSYFEYTTLLAMLFFSKKTDFIVLEAGLGGEYDATAVFKNDLTLVTPIADDHSAFLGNTVEAIAQTKLNAIQKVAIIAAQQNLVVYDLLEDLQTKKQISFFHAKKLLNPEDLANIKAIAQRESLPHYLQDNLALAIATLNYFKINYMTKDFYKARLFGRLTYLTEHIIVDVGHNVLAAEAIVQSLQPKKFVLIYNSYKDKDYKTILQTLKPIIKRVALIDVYNCRVEKSHHLQTALNELQIEWEKFTILEQNEDYLVFGSFSVVEAFLEVYHG